MSNTAQSSAPRPSIPKPSIPKPIDWPTAILLASVATLALAVVPPAARAQDPLAAQDASSPEPPTLSVLTEGVDSGSDPETQRIRRRLMAGHGADGAEPCWTLEWDEPKDPSTRVLWPAERAGDFRRSSAPWQLTADGQTLTPEGCSEALPPFPELALGPADELWLLDRGAGTPAVRGWGDWLQTVEAAWRQAAPLGVEPLATVDLGTLGGCTVRSAPVPVIPLQGPGLRRVSSHQAQWKPLTQTLHGQGEDDRAEDGQGEDGQLPDGTRRFVWWIEGGSEATCLADGRSGRLRLFPVPGATDDAPNTWLLSVEGAQALTLAGTSIPTDALDVDGWGPVVRRLVDADPTQTPAPPTPVAWPPAETNLCDVSELAPFCHANARVRRTLYTSIPEAGLEGPPPERHATVQRACGRAFEGLGFDAAPCTDPNAWAINLPGGLRTGFLGELPIAPQVRESAVGDAEGIGAVAWALTTTDRPEDLTLTLLSGQRITVPVERTRTAGVLANNPWILGTVGVALLMPMAAGWRRRRQLQRARLRRLVQEVVRQHLGRNLKPGGAPSPLRRLVAEVVRDELARADSAAHTSPATAPGQGFATLDDGSTTEAARVEVAMVQEVGRAIDTHRGEAIHRLEERAEALGEQLETTARSLGEVVDRQLAERLDPAWLDQWLEQRIAPQLATMRHLEPPPQTTAEAATLTVTAHPAVPETLRALHSELLDHPPDERLPWADAFAAAGRLVQWSQHLAATLAPGQSPEIIAATLPEAAAAEWLHSHAVLTQFASRDAMVLGRLAALLDSEIPNALAEDRYLEGTGLLESTLPFSARLKRYLEPFDHAGRLTELTLALQYLVEAYPIEQMSPDERAEFRARLRASLDHGHLDEDFHTLVAQLARGAGLLYRPVVYYKGRIDQTAYAFVRQQVSPISLSGRVGFDATTEPTVVVRLRRPFFFHLDSDVYYAGHAHVARD